MTEITRHVYGANGLKLAEIYCQTVAEMQTIDTAKYLGGTMVYVVETATLYVLNATSGTWYDADTNTEIGYGSALGLTLTLTDLTSTGATEAYKSKIVNLTLVPDDNYSLPSTIVLTIGGATKTVGVDYTYNAETGAVSIPAAKVLGAVVITAVGVADSMGDIVFEFTNITSTGDDEAFYKTQAVVTLVPAANYDLPAAISVLIDDVALTVDTDYTYVQGTGVVTVLAAGITGELTINAVAVGESQGNITYTLTNITNTGDVAALYGTEVNAVLTAAQYYDLPATIVVTVGGAPITVDVDYSYNPSTGAVSIFGSSVTGAVVITATGAAENYGAITETLTNLTAAGDETAIYGEDIDITLSAATNYDLPAEIVVSIGGAVKTITTDYTYDAETGAIHIGGAKVTGAVVITAVGVGESQGAITYTLTKLTETGDENALYGTEINFTLAAATGHSLPTTIAITVGGTPITVVDDYTYNAETGAVVISAEAVTGAVVVTALGVANSVGNIVFTLADCTATGDTEAFYETDVEVTLAPEAGHTLPATIIVVVNSEVLTVVTDYTYSAVTGEIVIAGAGVVGTVAITAIGEAEE